MSYQWYPGHMTKARRMMQENIKLIDLVIELVDARIPISSRNPDIDQLGQNKSRLILLNKADLADERQNETWKEYFKMFSISPDDENIPNDHIPVDAKCSIFCEKKNIAFHVTGGKLLYEIESISKILEKGTFIHS